MRVMIVCGLIALTACGDDKQADAEDACIDYAYAIDDFFDGRSTDAEFRGRIGDIAEQAAGTDLADEAAALLVSVVEGGDVDSAADAFEAWCSEALP